MDPEELGELFRALMARQGDIEPPVRMRPPEEIDTIARILEGASQERPTNFGELPDFLAPVADSIFTALGAPSQPVRFPLSPPEVSRFEPDLTGLTRGRISISPDMRAGSDTDLANILTHELTHEKVFNRFNTEASDIFDMFVEVFRGATPEQQKALYETYFPELPAETEEDTLKGIAEKGRLSMEFHEIFAKAMERGFDLARRFDPENFEEVSEELEEVEEELPGTKAAFGFFLRNFPRD